MFRQIRSVALVALAALLVLAACGNEAASLDPPEIAYGEDISEMGMFVVDPRYTVAALPQEGEWILFDDIGELFKYHGRHPGTEFKVTWVNDYHSEEWLKAEDAWYVQSAGFTTPMGWMVGAFEKESDAKAFHADHGGELLTWDDIHDREWTDPPAPDHELHGGHDSHEATPESDHSGHD